MAEETIEEKTITVQMTYDWQSAADTVSMRHANQVMVQVSAEELLLSFFVTSPPIVLGSHEQVMQQLASLQGKMLKAECVGRFSLTPKTFKSLIGLMQAKLAELEAQEDKGNGATI